MPGRDGRRMPEFSLLDLASKRLPILARRGANRGIIRPSRDAGGSFWFFRWRVRVPVPVDAAMVSVAAQQLLRIHTICFGEEGRPMAYLRQFTCDLCGIQKKLLNKWFLVEASDTCITISGFDSDKAQQEKFAILCGENCLQKYLSEKLVLLHTPPQPLVSHETPLASGSVGASGGKKPAHTG